MKSILYHFYAIRTTFEELFKGKYLLYFIPGAIITILFWYYYSTIAAVSTVDLSTGYSWLDWGTKAVESGISWFFKIINILTEQFYIFLVITVLSPFNTYLSEKLDADLTGQKFSGNLIRFINDIIRMIFVVILALVLELSFMLTYWLISFMLPNFLDPIVYHVIAAFFFGFSWYDFSLERYQKGVFSSLGFSFKNPIATILTGSIFIALYNIPFIGIPISPVIAVMISTIVYLYIEKKLPSNNSLQTETNNESNDV